MLDNTLRMEESKVLTGRMSVAEFISATDEAFRVARISDGSPDWQEEVSLRWRVYVSGLIERLRRLRDLGHSDREVALEHELLASLSAGLRAGATGDAQDTQVLGREATHPAIRATDRVTVTVGSRNVSFTQANRVISKIEPDLADTFVRGQGQNGNSSPAALSAADSQDAPAVSRIPFFSYLRSMWTLYWACILHPLTPTGIDLSTGRVIAPEEANAPTTPDDLD
jgi:hypothetical protein